jgi:2-dehydro-3-deoxy-D-arabinonate dehydratase
MKLTRHQTSTGPRWAVNGQFLAEAIDLNSLLEGSLDEMKARIAISLTNEMAHAPVLAPIESNQEVWASGVTYQRSLEARRAESDMGDVYDRVYDAQRPELFFQIHWLARHGSPASGPNPCRQRLERA